MGMQILFPGFFLGSLDVAGEGGAKGWEEALDVDHEELFAADEDF